MYHKIKKWSGTKIVCMSQNIKNNIITIENRLLGFYIIVLTLCSSTGVNHLDNLFSTEFEEKNVFRTLQHILKIKEYSSYISYLRIYCNIC